MHPTSYRQVSPPTRLGGRVVPGLPLGLFIRSDEVETVKAVPIIGEKSPEKTPSLVSSKGESLSKPAVPIKDLRSSSQPKVLGPSGQPVHASSPTPSPFHGSAAKFKPSRIVMPGAQPKASGRVLTTSHSPTASSGKVLGPSGTTVSSRLTEGPGAAKPGGGKGPSLELPGSTKPGSGKLELTSGSKPRSTTTAGEVQWGAAIDAAKKRESEAQTAARQKRAAADANEARSRPLDFQPKPKGREGPAPQYGSQALAGDIQAHGGATPQQKKMLEAGGVKATSGWGKLTPQQQKMMDAADPKKEDEQKPEGGKPEKPREPGKGPNILGHFGTGYQIGLQADPAATVSLVGHRAAAAAHGALSPPTPHEQARMQREGYQQRAEMLRQGARSAQSSLQRSLASSAGRPSMSPPVRMGLRR